MLLGEEARWDIMIRFYSVLFYGQQRSAITFSFTDIIKTLGLRNSNGPFLKMRLDWWQAIGLIDYKSQKTKPPQFGEYYLYTIQRIEYSATRAVDEYVLAEQSAPALQAWNLIRG